MVSKHKNRHKILKTFILVIAVLVISEIIALIFLATSVKRNKAFWEAKAKEPGEFTYLAIGDSAAQGIGATSPMRGYVGLIAKSLEKKTGKKVKVINVGVNGATVRDCIRDQLPQIKNIKADLVTIEIGANDVKANNPEAFKKDFEELIPLLPNSIYVSNMPLFNSRRSSTQPAKDTSKIIESLVKDNERFSFVDLQKQTSEHQSIFGFAPDLFHPNNLSYKNWYQAFWDQIEPNL